MRRAALYLRVSTREQTTANQERELREVAARMGCDIVKVYQDYGISGAKGRDKRPQFDALLPGCHQTPIRGGHGVVRGSARQVPSAFGCVPVREPRPQD